MADGGHLGTKSVLFTDLVGSTELRVRLGEEGADEFRRLHDSMLAEAVSACGGNVVKGLGDGIMATFDSAADAVAAAVLIQQSAYSHSRAQPDQRFGVRVGVSIGDVSAEEGDVFGVPVVEASRLCAVATGGEILVAELVRALARGRGGFAFEPMGDLELKGLPEPVPACRVPWEPAVAHNGETDGAVAFPPPLLGSITAYVGRQALLDRLSHEWDAVSGGSCRTVLLAGEPGVGKTRTAAELARQAFAQGATVLYGRCDEDLGVPYQPFVEALDHYVSSAADPALGRLPGELVRLVPDLTTRFEGLPDAVSSDPASEEFRLFEATASCLSEIAQANEIGLVLVLDDIHWATKPTLQLLAHVVRGAVDVAAPLLVLATYRDTDIDRSHPLFALLSDLRRLPGVERLAVENLSSGEVIDLITLAAGHDLDEQTRQLAGAIHAETEGNPFFVAEVLRHLIETGGVRREGDRWVVTDPDHLAVPEGVRDVVGRRLSRLSDKANEVLTVGAVVGRDFHIDVVLALVDGTEDVALDALDEAVRARLVEETGIDHYRFAHALVRTTLYDELSATRRRRLHRKVADTFEKLWPEDVRALAYHCTEAGADGGDLSRALRYTIAAAAEAQEAKAFAEAEARYRSALELLEDAEESEPVAYVVSLCGLGESQRDQAEAAFRETLLLAARRADELGQVELLVRAVLSNTRGLVSLVAGMDAERIGYIERALEVVPSAPSPDRTRLLARLAEEVAFAGDHARRVALADEAEAMARAIGDEQLLGEVLASTGFSSFHPNRIDALVERGWESVRWADREGDPSRRVVTRIFASGNILSTGDIAAAADMITEAVNIATEDGSPYALWGARSNAIRIPLARGDLDEAEREVNEVLSVGEALRQSDAPSWWAGGVVGLEWMRGTMGTLAAAIKDFADRYPTAMTWRVAEAMALSEGGRLDEARAIIAEFGITAQDMLFECWPFHTAAMFGYMVGNLGDERLGREAAAALSPHRSRWAHYYLAVMGPVTWPLGLARSVSGEHDEAIGDLQSALTTLEEKGFKAHTPRVRYDLACAYLRRDAAGDAEQAHALHTRGHAEAKALKLDGVVARFDALAL